MKKSSLLRDMAMVMSVMVLAAVLGSAQVLWRPHHHSSLDGSGNIDSNQNITMFKTGTPTPKTCTIEAATGNVICSGNVIGSNIIAAPPSYQKTNCAAVTTGNIALSGIQTIDGVSGATGTRILVTGQTTTSQNGIYVMGAGAWTRSTDMDATAEAAENSWTIVTGGTIFTNTIWYVSTAPATLGVDSLLWSQLSGSVSGLYYKLDTSNGPLTGNVEISKVTPTLKLIDTTRSSYVQIEKSNASHEAKMLNVTAQATTLAPYAANFSESNSNYYDAGDIAGIDATNTLTIAYWVKIPNNLGVANDYAVITKGTSGSATNAFKATLQTQGGGALVHTIDIGVVGYPSYATAYCNLAIYAGDWNYAVWVYAGTATGNTNRLKFYLNGSPCTLTYGGTIPATLPNAGTTPVIIGNTSTFNAAYKEAIDEVSLYAVAWSAGDVTTGYAAGVGLYGTATDTGLVAGWHFDEPLATDNATDYGAGANTGTRYGSIPKITGKVLGGTTPVTTTVDLVDSKQAVVAGDGDGITTFGDSTARTIVDGKSIDFNIGGVQFADIAETTGNVTATGSIILKGSSYLIAPGGVAVATSSSFVGNYPAGDASMTFSGTTFDFTKSITVTGDITASGGSPSAIHTEELIASGTGTFGRLQLGTGQPIHTGPHIMTFGTATNTAFMDWEARQDGRSALTITATGTTNMMWIDKMSFSAFNADDQNPECAHTRGYSVAGCNTSGDTAKNSVGVFAYNNTAGSALRVQQDLASAGISIAPASYISSINTQDKGSIEWMYMAAPNAGARMLRMFTTSPYNGYAISVEDWNSEAQRAYITNAGALFATGTISTNTGMTARGYVVPVWDDTVNQGRWAITSQAAAGVASGTYTFPHAYSTAVSCICSFYNSDTPTNVVACGIYAFSVSACTWQLTAVSTGTVYIQAFGY